MRFSFFFCKMYAFQKEIPCLLFWPKWWNAYISVQFKRRYEYYPRPVNTCVSARYLLSRRMQNAKCCFSLYVSSLMVFTFTKCKIVSLFFPWTNKSSFFRFKSTDNKYIRRMAPTVKYTEAPRYYKIRLHN